MVSFAVGKYGSRYRVFSSASAKTLALKPSIGSGLTDEDFEQRLITLDVDSEALNEFQRSAEATRNSSIAADLYPP